VNRHNSSKGSRKRTLWVLLSCVVIIAAILGAVVFVNRTAVRSLVANSPILNNPVVAAHNPFKARTFHPLPDTLLAPRTASRGNPLDFTIDSGQDVALATDQSTDVNQEFAGAFKQSYAADQSVTVHNGFASISIETYHICNFAYAPTQDKMRTLIKNLGAGGIIRVGGGSVDVTGWDGQSTRACSTTDLDELTTITPPMVQQLLEFAHSIGWRVIWSIGLQLKPAVAAEDAASVVSIANGIASGNDSPLLAITVGNEPEQDLMHGKATYQQFRAIWEAEAKAIKARVPSVVLFGGDTCCSNNDQWFKDFVKDDGGQIRSATNHIYPTSADSKHTPTIVQILSSAAIQNTTDTIDDLRDSAAAQHLPLLISETNSISNTPTRKVGQSFGQSLWMADYLFSAQEHGTVALGVHGGVPGDATSPFDGDGQSVSVQSTYYGMLFFAQADADGGHTVAVQSPDNTSLNVTVHAIRGKDGKLYVAVINKGGQAADIHINTGREQPQTAQAISLDAPAVDAQKGFQLGGAAVNADGTWSANHVETVPVSKNVASLSVAGYSATLVTFQPAP